MAAGELTVPVATVADTAGQTVRMDDYLGMVPLDADSAEYSERLRPQLPVRVHPVAGQDDPEHPVVLAPQGLRARDACHGRWGRPEAVWLLK